VCELRVDCFAKSRCGDSVHPKAMSRRIASANDIRLPTGRAALAGPRPDCHRRSAERRRRGDHRARVAGGRRSLMDAPSDVESQVRAAGNAAVEFLTADLRRGRLLGLARHGRPVAAWLESIRAIANAIAAMTRDVLGGAAPTRLDADLVGFTIIRGTLKLVAAWLCGDYAVSHKHLVDLVAPCS
jgi:hypothetical protein